MTYAEWSPVYLQMLLDVMYDSSLEADLPPRGERTGDFLHASTLLEMLHPQDNALTRAELAIFATMGLAWEDRAERALIALSKEDAWPWECWRPGEFVRDRVACNPDIIFAPKDGGEAFEMSIKLTWKSSKEAPDGPKFGYYRDQCLTYATPMQTTKAVLFVGFVLGRYQHQLKDKSKRKPPAPEVRAWELQWSERERIENWQAILNLRNEKESHARQTDRRK